MSVTKTYPLKPATDGALPLSLSATLIRLMAKPSFNATSVTSRSASVQKKAEQALRESDQRYRTLFEESIDGVYSVLRDGEITDANPSFRELFGYTREELIGKDIRDLFVDPADRPKFQEEIETKGFVKDYAIKYRKRDGTEMDCLSTSSVYFGKMEASPDTRASYET